MNLLLGILACWGVVGGTWAICYVLDGRGWQPWQVYALIAISAPILATVVMLLFPSVAP